MQKLLVNQKIYPKKKCYGWHNILPDPRPTPKGWFILRHHYRHHCEPFEVLCHGYALPFWNNRARVHIHNSPHFNTDRWFPGSYAVSLGEELGSQGDLVGQKYLKVQWAVLPWSLHEVLDGLASYSGLILGLCSCVVTTLSLLMLLWTFWTSVSWLKTCLTILSQIDRDGVFQRVNSLSIPNICRLFRFLRRFLLPQRRMAWGEKEEKRRG